MENKTIIAWIGTVLTLISGWDKIIAFGNSMINGFTEFWQSVPPLLQLGVIIWLFWLVVVKNK